MSTPSASRNFRPAIWIPTLLAVAVAAVVAGGYTGHSAQTASAIAATGLPALAPSAEGNAEQQVRASLGALPLAFEANQGQTDPRVKYMARGSGYTLFLTPHDVVFALRSSSLSATERSDGRYESGSPRPVDRRSDRRSGKDVTTALHMQLVGGNSQAQSVAGAELPGKSNYFIGKDRSQWRQGVKQYAAVSYREVYPGVNLAFHGAQRQLEFDFVVARGADASPVILRFSGASNISTDDSGALTLATPAGNVTLHPPVAYQDKEGVRQSVSARFVRKAADQVGFALGSYDHSRELVIDPSVSYATYLGGTAEDDGYSIAVDNSGNAYVTGQTRSTDFPTVAGSYSTNSKGGFDVFVTKISANGSSLLYSTYVGGSLDDSGNAIAVDASGDAFVAGGTASTDFPTTAGAKQTTSGGGGLDAFIFELSSSGGSLVYSTYLGGSGADFASGIALDSSGNAYVVGSTASGNFPTHNPIQGQIAGTLNGFVTKLNSSGNALVYSTFLGGGSNDVATAVAVDASDNAYVTGATKNPTFPTTNGVFQRTCGSDGNCNGGLYDAFVSVINAAGSGFVYSTFLGGENSDQGFGIAVDSAGDAYVTGLTKSTTHFPLKAALQGTFAGGLSDAFVTALNPQGSAPLYSTYLGGSGDDSGQGIAVEGNGTAYVTGETSSIDFKTASPTQPANGGGDDAFVSEIGATGALIFSTYLGGSLNENALVGGGTGAIAVDKAGANFYVTGNTVSTNFPTHAPKQASNAGGTDAFVARFAQANFTIAATELTPASVTPGNSATSTVTIAALNSFSSSVALTCSVSPAPLNAPTCGFSKTSITPGVASTLTVSTTASTPGGSYTVTVTGTSGGLVHSTTVTLSVSDFTISASALTPAAVDPGGSATSTVTVGALNGFSSPVALTCSVSPATTTPPTCNYTVTPVTPPTTSTLTVNSAASATPGNYTITVTGTASGTAHSTTVHLTINGFHISATAPAAVNAGTSGTSTVTLTALNGYSFPVNLTCSVTGTGAPPPACSAASFSVNPVTPTSGGAQTILTITTTPNPKAAARHRSVQPALWLVVGGISLMGMCFVSAGTRRKKVLGLLLLGSVMVALFLLPSCGSSNNSGGGGPCTTVPTAPTGLAASSTTSTGTTLNWTASTVDSNCNLQGYSIHQNGGQIGTSNTTSFNVTGLSPSTTYTFTVLAGDGAGLSPESAPLNVKTASGGTPAGNYTITISGTDANDLSNSTQVILTVN